MSAPPSARLRRDLRAYERNSPTTSSGIQSYLRVLIAWIQGRTDRNNAKPGGLGKKPKVKQSLTLSPKSLAAKIKDAKKSFPAINSEVAGISNN